LAAKHSDDGFDGTGSTTKRWLPKEKYHAIKDASICDCNPAYAGFACAWTGWWWFEWRFVRNVRQRRLERRTRNLDWHKFGSERHGSYTCPDAWSVVQFPIKLRHSGNRFKRQPDPKRDWPDAGAHAGSIDFGA
jgi:hypothetical protein